MTQDRVRWQGLVNTVMTLRFSGRLLFRGVSSIFTFSEDLSAITVLCFSCILITEVVYIASTYVLETLSLR
jgi:hypothetical protein